MGKTVSNETDGGTVNLAKELFTVHIEAYYAAGEAERAEMCRLLDNAWREGRDMVSEVLPGGEWRQAWPEGARAAILALWATPR
jgi:hypothetical protein